MTPPCYPVAEKPAGCTGGTDRYEYFTVAPHYSASSILVYGSDRILIRA
jgi:hypothetical protein